MDSTAIPAERQAAQRRADRSRVLQLRRARQFYRDYVRTIDGLTPGQQIAAEHALFLLWRELHRSFGWTGFAEAIKFARAILVKI